MEPRARVFALTFLGYAAFHVARRSLSLVKPDLVALEWFGSSAEHTTHALAVADTAFMVAYAGGLFYSGWLGDRVERRWALFASLWLTALTVLLFALLGSMGVRTASPFLLVWACSGLVQSAGWPLSVSVMSDWFPAHQRGRVLGAWSANGPVGNILGAIIVGAALKALAPAADAWVLALSAAALPALAMGVALLSLLPGPPRARKAVAGAATPQSSTASPAASRGGYGALDAPAGGPAASPADRRHDVPAASTPQPPASPKATATEEEPCQGIGFLEAWALPHVSTYAACYGGVKLVAYGLMNWLPIMIVQVWATAAD